MPRRKGRPASSLRAKPSWRVRTDHPSAPPRDVDVVDADARSYRIVSLYKFLLCDSQAYPPDPNDLRLKFEGRDSLEIRRQIADLVADRGRISEALHAGEPVVIPRWRLDGYVWRAEIEHVPWLIDRSVGWIEVSSDDVVRPANGC